MPIKCFQGFSVLLHLLSICSHLLAFVVIYVAVTFHLLAFFLKGRGSKCDVTYMEMWRSVTKCKGCQKFVKKNCRTRRVGWRWWWNVAQLQVTSFYTKLKRFFFLILTFLLIGNYITRLQLSSSFSLTYSNYKIKYKKLFASKYLVF